MFPIIALVFGGISATGLLYNLVFVPWFSLIVVPITFSCTCFSAMVVCG
ncbi:ComEC/Rec2 family competence protein [Vibrio sinaloensis]|nr:ComEC/Rec2 family competence protein [Vibrio sinaloensis]